VLLPVLGRRGAVTLAETASAVALAFLKVAALVAFTMVVGKRAIPAMLAYVAKTRSRELFTLTVLVVALGIAVAAARLTGASIALGAFLAGMVVGQSEFSARAASEALPMRDAFAVLFFVSVGMLFDPAQALANAGLAAATLGVVLVGKPLAVFGVVRLLGQPAAIAATTAVAVAQIGEFSFVVASLGRSLGLVSDSATQAIVVASIVSITFDPILYRLVQALSRRLELGGSGKELRGGAGADDGRYRAIVVGYGPVGRTLTHLLRQNGLSPTVVELNHETVAELRGQGIGAVYGDASRMEILRRAGAGEAMSLVFAASGSAGEAVIRAARELNPEIQVLARAAYVREAAAMTRAGAHVVVAAEAEVALAMTEHLLTQLGATSEQLDRERERVRGELGGASAPQGG
jgi:CPA2 family monovalent cation:H+ antiporter-2